MVFAGTSDGLLQSIDGGLSWQELFGGAVRSIAFDPGNLNRLFIATDRGVYRSDDNGKHFAEANKGEVAP